MRHQLTTWNFDNRSDPRAIQMVQIPGTRAENRCKTPGVRAWNCLMHRAARQLADNSVGECEHRPSRFSVREHVEF